MNGRSDYHERPSSEQMTDLAVYIVPPELWREALHSAVTSIIEETISAGFIRVHPEMLVSQLRQEIDSQLDDEAYVPQEYVFLKNVGRCLTKVRKKQEMQLKVKNFIVPKSFSAEIFLLEGGSDTQSIHPSSVTSSYRGEPANQEDPYQLDNYRSKGTFASQKQPVPPIKPGESISSTNTAYPASNSAASSQRSYRTPRHPLTNSQTSVNSVHSQTDSISTQSVHSLDSDNSATGAEQAPPIMSNPHSKTVTFDPHRPQASSNHHRYPRPPTPGRLLEDSFGKMSTSQATQWSRQNSDAALTSPTVALLVQNGHKSPNANHPHSGPNDFDEDMQTPPPLSATPTQSPYPLAANLAGGEGDRERQEEYLPPLSCTPPLTSPGSRIKPKITSEKKDPATRSNQDMANLAHGNDRWEDRNGYHNRSSASLKREEDATRRRQEAEARRRQEEEARRRQEEEARRRQEEEARRRQEEEAKRRLDEEQRSRDEANRKKQRELSALERQRAEDEERRRRIEEEEEERRRRQQEIEDEERRRREEENIKNTQLRIDGQSNNRSDYENQKDTLLDELAKLKQERQSTEKEREELVRKAKQLQSRTQNKRNQARDVWKKKYFEEKKKSPPLEEQCTKLRQELDAVHRRIVSSLEGTKDSRRGVPLEKPSPESNVKIQATRLQHEIEDLQRRVETIKMKLTAEMKLRHQAETELRALRAELTQKKINVTLSRRGQRDDRPDLYTPRNQPVSSRT